MIKNGDQLKYFKYRYIWLEPQSTVSIVALIIAACLCFFISVYPCLVPFVLFLSIFPVLKRRKRLNDYLIMVKYPFNSYAILCQDVRRGIRRKRSDFGRKRAAFLQQMQQVLGNLPPGYYKTITQPMFTREIMKCPRVKIIKREKAYRKRIDVLMKQIYAFDIIEKHRSYTQFYYIKFEIIK